MFLAMVISSFISSLLPAGGAFALVNPLSADTERYTSIAYIYARRAFSFPQSASTPGSPKLPLL